MADKRIHSNTELKAVTTCYPQNIHIIAANNVIKDRESFGVLLKPQKPYVEGEGI